MKGTIHNIHKLDGIWMFKYVLIENKRSSIHRIPFVFKEGTFENGQELEVVIESVQGIDVARPK
jgi:hypothetical protein